MTARLSPDGRISLFGTDCLSVLKTLPDNSVDSVVTDPPYHLTSVVKRFGAANAAPAQHGTDGLYARQSRGFMGKLWDGGDIAFRVELWTEVLRVLKPGGQVVAFSGTRTYHRMACAIEDAGFEIRDMVAWLYGVGFPKSHSVDDGIDDFLFGRWLDADPARRAAYRAEMKEARSLPRAEAQKAAAMVDAKWRALGGFVPTVLSEGPTVKRIIPGADQHKNGRTKDDGAEYVQRVTRAATPEGRLWDGWGTALKPALEPICLARKPLIGTVAENVLAHGTGAINVDGCRVGDDGGTRGCTAGPSNGILGDGLNGAFGKPIPGLGRWPANITHDGSDEVLAAFPQTGDSGSAARFFYCAKASKADRAGSKHPTVKPVNLMRWLCRLITPPGGVVLDPFAGSGTTGQAAREEGFDVVLIEREAEYLADIERRLGFASDLDFLALDDAPSEISDAADLDFLSC